MDDDKPSGIPITVTSLLAVGALAALCCALATAIALVTGWSDPTWTNDMKLVGALCAGGMLLLAAGMVGTIILRRVLRKRW